MITIPTTLVLGAGASMPYDYPSGRGLVNMIVAGVETKLWKQIISDCGEDEQTRIEFRRLLRTAETVSIDAWLAYQPDFIRVGKLAIALALFNCEDDSKIQNRDGCDGIYHELLDLLYTAPEEFFEHKLRVVTFNYDRSLEQCLHMTLQSRYRGTSELIQLMAQSIPVEHVHGYLGPLPWQAPAGRPYGRIKDYPWGRTHQEKHHRNRIAREIQDASDRIVIMKQEEAGGSQFERAVRLLEESKRIYFIGFGYDPTNVRNLVPERWKGRGNIVRGTCVGISPLRQGPLGGQLGIGLVDSSVGALDFVRGHAAWD